MTSYYWKLTCQGPLCQRPLFSNTCISASLQELGLGSLHFFWPILSVFYHAQPLSSCQTRFCSFSAMDYLQSRKSLVLTNKYLMSICWSGGEWWIFTCRGQPEVFSPHLFSLSLHRFALRLSHFVGMYGWATHTKFKELHFLKHHCWPVFIGEISLDKISKCNNITRRLVFRICLVVFTWPGIVWFTPIIFYDRTRNVETEPHIPWKTDNAPPTLNLWKSFPFSYIFQCRENICLSFACTYALQRKTEFPSRSHQNAKSKMRSALIQNYHMAKRNPLHKRLSKTREVG